MMQLVILVFGLVGPWLLGVAVARRMLLGRASHCTTTSAALSMPEQAGLGIVFGIGLTGWGLFLWSLAGGVLDQTPSLIISGMGFACAIPLAIRWFTCRRESSVPQPIVTIEQRRENAFCRFCQVVIGCWIAMAMVESLLTPQRLWDERAIFGIKAAVLFEDKTISSRDLADADFIQGHPRYPLLLPLAEEHIYALLGKVDDRLSKVLFPLLYAGLVLTTVGVLSRHLPGSLAWLWGVLLATVPALMPHEYGFLCGQADAPVACYHGVALLYAWDFLERLCEQRQTVSVVGAAAVAGLCTGLTAFTKDEGIAFLMVDGTVLVLLVLIAVSRSRSSGHLSAHSDQAAVSVRPALLALVVFAGCASGVLVPWFLHRRSLPHTTEMNYFGRLSPAFLVEKLGTLTWSIPHMAQRMFVEWREWGFQWWLVVIALVLAPRQLARRGQMLLLLDMLGAIAALLVAGMLAPVRLEEHLGGSSQRFLMQISPVAVLFAAGQTARIRQRGQPVDAAQTKDSAP